VTSVSLDIQDKSKKVKQSRAACKNMSLHEAAVVFHLANASRNNDFTKLLDACKNVSLHEAAIVFHLANPS
jgi:hypothetical protein